MIRSAKISRYVKRMVRDGWAAADVLAGTGIDLEVLTRPDGLVSLDSYQSLIVNMMRISENPAIAFMLGETADVSEYGILGYAMLSSRTVGEMIHIRQRYEGSTFGTVIHFDSARENESGIENQLFVDPPCDSYTPLRGRGALGRRLEHAEGDDRHTAGRSTRDACF